MATVPEPITNLNGIGESVAAKYARIGVRTIDELIDYLPKKYLDYSRISKLAQIKPGQVCLRVQITSMVSRYARRGLHITEALACDSTGSIKLVWFNQPFRYRSILTKEEYFISGEFGLHSGRMSIINPNIERVSQLNLHTARIIPIYKETKGLSSLTIRKHMAQALDKFNDIPELLPTWIVESNNLMSNSKAYMQMHFPSSTKLFELAKYRLGFDEIFKLSLASLINKREFAAEKSTKITFDLNLVKKFISKLPFNLTNDQKIALWAIFKDFEKNQPMNRLLEGDVGSGKTVVAALAAAMALNLGYSVSFMAPTEILANQHAKTLYELMKTLGFEDKVVLLTGSLNQKTKKALKQKITKLKSVLVIGTHALITEDVVINNLALVIIDEQHRFGVDQRKLLQQKAGVMPHVLNMSATPIPRTLALTLFGELDISIISTMPVGRLPVRTEIVNPESKNQMYDFVREQIDSKHQVFVVCSLITDIETTKFMSAEKMYRLLSTDIFKNYKIGLLHGKMSATQKDQVMQDFVNRKLDILVSTTVIEVGVDIPNATVMIIENAEKFGLAQMHQLRGRIGRSSNKSHCFVVPSTSDIVNSSRLRAFIASNDGFKLAQLDMELRGPGAIYGTLQSGALDLRVAKLSDHKLIAAAKSAAHEFISRGENLIQYKQLANQVNRIRSITNLN